MSISTRSAIAGLVIMIFLIAVLMSLAEKAKVTASLPTPSMGVPTEAIATDGAALCCTDRICWKPRKKVCYAKDAHQ